VNSSAPGQNASVVRRKPFIGVAFLFAARVFSSLANVTVLGIAASHFPIDLFADFALLVGLVAWVPVLDYGFGSVLQNRVSAQWALSVDDPKAAAACIATLIAFAVVLTPIAMIVLLLVGRLATHGLLQHPAVLILAVGCLSISGVAAVVHKIFAARQSLMVSAGLSALQNLLALCGLLVSLRTQAGKQDLIMPLIGYFLPYTIVPVIAFVIVGHRARWAGALTSIDLRSLLTGNVIIRESMHFWMVVLLSLMVIQFDQFVAFKYLNAKEFSHYTVATKLIGFIYFPFSALLTANWSRVAIAHSHQNRSRVMAIVHSSVWFGALFLLASLFALVLFVSHFPNLVPRGGGNIELGILVGVGLVALNKVWTEAYSLIYLATGNVGVITSYLPIQAAIAVGLEFLLVRYFGAYGLMMGGAISYFATSHWILASRTNRVFCQYLPGPRPATSTSLV
jgi:O-antigen/teichoic acid export membrane protein